MLGGSQVPVRSQKAKPNRSQRAKANRVGRGDTGWHQDRMIKELEEMTE